MSKPILFQEGADVGTQNYFKIYSTPSGSKTKTFEWVRITIIDTSPSPKYKIEKTHNHVISVFNYPDGVYDIINTTLFKVPSVQVYIKKVKEEQGNEPAVYKIERTEGDAARRGGNSLRHVSRKRKSNRRRGSNKKYSASRGRRSRRVRRTRKN